METRTVLLLCLLLTLMTLTECSRAKRENQPPTDADQQRVEQEYRQSLDKLHELTSGTKETLDGKTPPHSKAKRQPTPQQ